MISPRFTAAFLMLLAFGVYLYGAYPTVSAGDSGEFITAGHTLGIPHAPGFPTYVVLAKTFETFIPFGNIGYRINLFSAVCGAAAVVVLFFIGLRLKFSPWVAAGGALLFLWSNAHRVNAQASEVFALHALFCASVLWAALADQWVLAAFLAGLGVGNHQTVLFLGPALAFTYFLTPSPGRVPLSNVVLGLLAGLSIYLFLWVRAGGAPILNLGNPNTLERFWRVLTRADYGTLTLALGDAPARTAAMTVQHLIRFVQHFHQEVSWAGVAIGLLGILTGLKHRGAAVYLLLGAFLLIGPAFFLLGNLPFNAQSTGLLERFYIVPTLCWVLLMGFGVQAVFQLKRWAGFALLLIPLFVCVPDALAHLADFRDDLRAYAYGRNNLRTLAPNALFLMDGGDDTFYTLSYLRAVEKRRLDMNLYDCGGVVFPGFYGSDFRTLTREEKEARRQQVERVALGGARPLFYSTMNDQVLPGIALNQRGLLYSALPSHESFWAFYDLRGIAPWQASSMDRIRDYRTRALAPFYAYQRSVQAGRQQQWHEALAFSESSFRAGSDVVWLLPNLRYNGYRWVQRLFELNQMVLAEKLCYLLTAWDPESAIAWSNLGAIQERRQHLDAAIASYQRAISLDPRSETALYNLSVVYWKQSNWSKVIETLDRVLAINPNHAAARNYWLQARARAKQ